jgi:hypothetical protein
LIGKNIPDVPPHTGSKGNVKNATDKKCKQEDKTWGIDDKYIWMFLPCKCHEFPCLANPQSVRGDVQDRIPQIMEWSLDPETPIAGVD